ncbi:hypothetical protein [Opitutus terrae]|uniref:Carbohydrate-binding protein n=1 Tax=Opitutus terrae (strain DSM 11246 / JCM 15787 / PB90-1) TaxID=452637 RepID=B1ZNF8_OPITP|nr:hypothetical protein [Opitutus terrae]ACB74392.1 hypothetical protein Oter_1104 [Opitutus terrae PB90-1]
MIKRTISTATPRTGEGPGWLRLDDAAEVEISSESETNPIEAALLLDDARGWRADAPGEQTIRLKFLRPHALRRVRVVFEEHERERTQQFALRAAIAPANTWTDIVRQQFNFSPVGATREEEEYRVDLREVTTLELTIKPDLRGGDARASLQELRIS